MPGRTPHAWRGCGDGVQDQTGIRELRTLARDWPSWALTPRQLADLELLTNGGFHPLNGFLGRADYDTVVQSMRLADGTLWPIPITLDVDAAFAAKLQPGAGLTLRDPEGVALAVVRPSDVWQPDLEQEALHVYGTTDPDHPGVAALLRGGDTYVGGRVVALQPIERHDHVEHRHTPAELRAEFARRGWTRIVAFQTRNPIHRSHFELTQRAARALDAKLLLHPVVGPTKPGDLDPDTRVATYRAVLAEYPPESTLLSLLPLAMRMAGPREAVLHAIVRRNHGCTHLIVGRDHAGPGTDAAGKPFYGPLDAQRLAQAHADEIGIGIVASEELVYVADLDRHVTRAEVPTGAQVTTLSGTELRNLLRSGTPIPSWYTFESVARVLQAGHPPRDRQGCTLFFTGLSGAGKSTIAIALRALLGERTARRVTVLDGDIVRRHLSSELGFSRRDRDLNIRRIGFVASEITRHGGIAICAPIAPYDAVRREVRAMVEPHGGFVLVHVATPLDVCEARDRKGLYARARAGTLPAFTGISDPYEAPTDAEIVLDASGGTPAEHAGRIVDWLVREGYLASPR